MADQQDTEPGDADSTQTLKLLVTYRRAELDGVVRGLEREDTKAAWVIASSLAVGSFAATGFGAIGVPNAATLVLLIIGATLLLSSALLAFAIRDTAVSENLVGKVMGVLVSPMRVDIREIPQLRGRMRPHDGERITDGMTPDHLLHEIAAELHQRLEAAKDLAEKLNAQGRHVMLGLTLALGFLSTAAIAALTSQDHHPTPAQAQTTIVVLSHLDFHGRTPLGSVTDSKADLIKFATDVAANALGSAAGGVLTAGLTDDARHIIEALEKLHPTLSPKVYLGASGPFIREVRTALERIHLKTVIDDRDGSPSQATAQVDCPHYYLELDALSDDERAALKRSPAADLKPIAQACGFHGVAALDHFAAYLAQH